MFWYILTQFIECFPLDLIEISADVSKRINKYVYVYSHEIPDPFNACFDMNSHNVKSVFHWTVSEYPSPLKTKTYTNTNKMCFHAQKNVSRQANVFAHNLICLINTPKQVFCRWTLSEYPPPFFRNTNKYVSTHTKVFQHNQMCLHII